MKTLKKNFGGNALLLAAIVIALAACNGNGVHTVPVEGQITYGGGMWPAEGTLYFVPIRTDGAVTRAGMARFSKQGDFAARTFTDGDGLIPGRYTVKVECWEQPPTLAPNAPEAKSYVPPAIREGTAQGWQIEVPSDQKLVELSFDVPKP